MGAKALSAPSPGTGRKAQWVSTSFSLSTAPWQGVHPGASSEYKGNQDPQGRLRVIPEGKVCLIACPGT